MILFEHIYSEPRSIMTHMHMAFSVNSQLLESVTCKKVFSRLFDLN